MKKLLLSIVLLLSFTSSFAQRTIKEGNNYVQQPSQRVPKDTVVTTHTWKDAQGNIYSIILNRNSGSCYVWRKSKKGKMYKDYMESWVSIEISSEYGIEYKPRNRK